MPDSFAVYPAHLGHYDVSAARLRWAMQISQPLSITPDVTLCRAYLVMGDDTSAICDTFDQHLDWPEHLVIWIDDDGHLTIYTCRACFRGGLEATPEFVQRLFDSQSARPDIAEAVFALNYRQATGAATSVSPAWLSAIDDAIAALNTGDDRHGAEIERLETLRSQLDAADDLEVVITIDRSGIADYQVPPGVRVRVFDHCTQAEPETFLYTAAGEIDRQPLMIKNGADDEDDRSLIAHWITQLERGGLQRGSQMLLRHECQARRWFVRLLTSPQTVLASWECTEDELDAMSNEIATVLEARNYQLLDDPDEFTGTPAAPARLPAIDEWVMVYPKHDWPAQAFTGRVSDVRGDRVTVIDQADDAWDVDLDQVELAESDDEADDETDDEPEGDDMCDNCFASDVVCEQTCACGKTLCVECATDNDGLCGECAANAEETESDEVAADTEAVERVVEE